MEKYVDVDVEAAVVVSHEIQCDMFTVQLTESFQGWLDALTDMRAQLAIVRRLDRISTGNFGDSKTVGDHVSELRVNMGPGYRVYFTKRGNTVVIILAGGDKSSQTRDIKAAQRLAKEIP